MYNPAEFVMSHSKFIYEFTFLVRAICATEAEARALCVQERMSDVSPRGWIL